MNCNRNRNRLTALQGCCAGLAFLMPSVSASAQDRAPVIRAVRAGTHSDVTTIDIALTAPIAATLRDGGNSLVVTLPRAMAGPRLAEHLVGSGVVSGIGLEDVGWGERLTLVLRSPAGGRIIASQDRSTVRIVVGPQGRLAGLSPVRFAQSPPRPRLVFRPICVPTPRFVAVAPRPMAAVPRSTALTVAPILPAMPVAATVFAPAVAVQTARLYNVNAYRSDLAGVLNSLAQDSRVSIVMAGPVNSKVTMRLRQVPLEKAVDLLTRSAGLGYHRDGDVFMVGDAKDLAAAYPVPVSAVTQTVYQCLHVTAADLAAALRTMFDKDNLRVSVGAAPSSPRLDDATTSDVTGVKASTMKGGGGDTGGLSSHLVVLAGEQDVVAQALDLARKLDVRRAQVKIGVQITDINRSALKNLGLQWSFGGTGFHESQPTGIGFGSFTRDPLSVTATITALENSGDAKLLAAPNMSILDGERGFILIGDRIQYPKLTGYTQAQTPIYDVTEERVGIYLQVAVQMEDNGEMTLTVYPQVSTVSGYLNVNGGSYPQISTREQQTTIRVKDGQQIVIGGLIRDEEIKNVQKVPILSSIPLFRELFTYRNTTKQQSEVVIVITPQILKG